MKVKIAFVLIFIALKIFGCKCEPRDLKGSFKSAEFVFIGNIYDVIKVPSGFKTLDNYLSKVKIEKIYKDNSYPEFYKNTATIFASQLRSCDYIFDKKGKYLIFANYEPDTGFLYSDQCFFIKPFAEFSKDEWELLSKLGLSHRNSDVKNFNEGNIELVIDDLFNQPNRKITNLQQENEKLSKDNKTYRLVSIISILLLILFFVFIRKIKK